MSLNEALAYIKKEVKDALEFDTHLVGISTGSLAVDMIIGIGGFPRRRVCEVFGWESSGKTTLCLAACAAAQRKGLYPAYIDCERGVTLVHADKIGFNYKDESKGLYATPFSFEDTAKVVNALAESGDVDLIIVDSVPGMVPQDELEGEIDEQGAIGKRARLMAAFLARITKVIDKNNVALVFCNQMRARISTDRFDHGPKEQAAGGSALKFYTSLRIDLTNVKTLTAKKLDPILNKEVESPIANLHRAEAFKNKLAVPYRRTEFYIKYGDGLPVYGIDNLQTIIDMAKSAGIIQSSPGGYYKYTGPVGNFSLRGTDELYMHIGSNQDVLKEIRASLKI